MGIITLQSEAREVQFEDFRTSNITIRVSSLELKITQFEYEIPA